MYDLTIANLNNDQWSDDSWLWLTVPTINDLTIADDGWLHPQATNSSAPVTASKRMTLKKLPPLLVLHLSRFYHDGAGADPDLKSVSSKFPQNSFPSDLCWTFWTFWTFNFLLWSAISRGCEGCEGCALWILYPTWYHFLGVSSGVQDISKRPLG